MMKKQEKCFIHIKKLQVKNGTKYILCLNNNKIKLKLS